MTTAAKTDLAMILMVTAWLVALSAAGLAEETRPPQPAESAKTSAGPECVECGQSPLYHRQESLQETLLTTRQRYAAWLAEQPVGPDAGGVRAVAGDAAPACGPGCPRGPAGRSHRPARQTGGRPATLVATE